MNKAKSKGIVNPTKIAIAVLIVSIFIVIFASRILYQRTVDLLTENLRERILTVSITAASNINSDDLEALKVESDWEKPEWSRVVNQLHKAKYSNKDIVFMYIFRKKSDDPTQMEFVADADSIDPYANTGGDSSRYVDVNRDGVVEPDGPDKLQWPGQGYPEAVDIPEAFEAYNGPLTSKDLYTDDYGTVLTGYAPIKDQNGDTVAVLATDIKADDFFAITEQTLRPFLIFIAFLTTIISILIVIIISAWRRYAKSLEKLNIDLKEVIQQRESLVHLITHKVKGSFTRTKYIFAEMISGSFGEVTPETKKIVDKTVAEKKISAESKGLKLETGISNETFNVLGDAFWLREVVLNLIDNSVKYTKEGTIMVGLLKQAGKIIFSVKDTGVGINPEDKKNLFTEGGRGKESVKMNVDSTGYGLFSVKLIVDAHGGRVWVESLGPGHGATFFVELDAV